ncbi:MAG TPA: hypothetical protein VGN34_23115 [Ktedonobacteraceae bacterium]
MERRASADAFLSSHRLKAGGYPERIFDELSASGGPVPADLTPASWLAWLDEITSFAFHSQSGSYCTVRKEIIHKSEMVEGGRQQNICPTSFL